MPSQVYTGAVAVNQADVLYVGQQINRDLIELSKAYPDKLPLEKAVRYFNSYTTFLLNAAITELGFSIYDPLARNLVYHEYRYEVHYGSVTTGGQGGHRVARVWLPASATFTPWVAWSEEMLSLPEDHQEQIVAGTEWNIPSKNGTFNGRYDNGNWSSGGSYGRGSLEVAMKIFRL